MGMGEVHFSVQNLVEISCVGPLMGDLSWIPFRGGDVRVPTSFQPQLSCGGLDEGDSVTVPLDGGHVNHLGKVLCVVADDGEDELGSSILATPGVYNPGANLFFFLSSLPGYTCSSLEDDAVVLLLFNDGPVFVTGEWDGDQACFS
jgi:hypothetical protein